VGVDSGDSGDQPVGVGEVEAGVEAEGHDGGGGAGGAHAGEQAEDAGLGVEAEVVIALGEGQDLGEVLALDPVLVLAGDVAGVGADLEHGDDDDLDLDGFGGGGLADRGDGRRREEHEEHEEREERGERNIFSGLPGRGGGAARDGLPGGTGRGWGGLDDAFHGLTPPPPSSMQSIQNVGPKSKSKTARARPETESGEDGKSPALRRARLFR
jgi:hypothetical protein